MKYTPLEIFELSKYVMEVLEKALGGLTEYGFDFYGDLTMRKLYDELQDLVYEYEKHHEVLRDEARFYEEEEAM